MKTVLGLAFLMVLLTGCQEPAGFANPDNPKPAIDGDIVYLNVSAACEAGKFNPDCYFQSKTAARKVVRQFSKLGIKNYLFPVVDGLGNDLTPYLVFSSALDETGGGFFLQEISPWIEAKKNCKTYLQKRGGKLQRLSRLTGAHFLGFSDDEPQLARYETENLRMKQCLQSVPAFKDKIWLTNLYPILAGVHQLQRGGTDSYKLADFGGCALANLPEIEKPYAAYTDTVFQNMKPDIGSFDLYPFNKLTRNCPDAAATFLKENLKILMQAQQKHGFYPATYLQASESIYADRATAAQVATSREIAEQYGIKTFLYFLSHNTSPKEKPEIKGMLDAHNNPTPIYANHLMAFEKHD